MKLQVICKKKNKNRQIKIGNTKLLQILEWNSATESAHTETLETKRSEWEEKKEYLCALMVD